MEERRWLSIVVMVMIQERWRWQLKTQPCNLRRVSMNEDVGYVLTRSNESREWSPRSESSDKEQLMLGFNDSKWGRNELNYVPNTERMFMGYTWN